MATTLHDFGELLISIKRTALMAFLNQALESSKKIMVLVGLFEEQKSKELRDKSLLCGRRFTSFFEHNFCQQILDTRVSKYTGKNGAISKARHSVLSATENESMFSYILE